MTDQVYLAVDLGASSGRVLAGSFSGQKLRIEELHRFVNGPVTLADSMFWDLPRLWSEVLAGLRAGNDRCAGRIASVGVDTWGVDFGLLGRGDVLLGNPYHYRDARTLGVLERACAAVGRETIFKHTGLQFLPFNTLFQLLAMRETRSPLLDAAERLLLMPDLFHWLLCGEKSNERTNASTTQFYDPLKGDWSTELLAKLELPTRLLGTIVDPGARLGKLRARVAEETRLAAVEVIAPATHDTASAVLAVPADVRDGSWCYISSGTWSLLGAELDAPVLSDACQAANFTNEIGVGRTVRLLKNIGGLWLLQESRRAWADEGREYTWEQLLADARRAKPLAALVDPDHASLLAPRHMPRAIADYCRATGQRAPADVGGYVRCILESLALKYRFVLESLEAVSGRRHETIHTIGGGAQNADLCQFTANACHRIVLAGPVEATAIGNALAQAMALGTIGNVAEAREVVRQSFPIERYEPREVDVWEAAYARFTDMLKG